MARRPTRDTSRPDDPIRVVLVGPESIVGLGIRRAIELDAGIDVIGDSESPAEAIALLAGMKPDVIVVDIRLREQDDVDATRRLQAEAGDAAMVVVGGANDALALFGAIEAGATAHVTDLADPSGLMSAIRRAARGEDQIKEELVARPDLVEGIVDALREGLRRQDERAAVSLTARELEVLRGVARGLRNREIAVDLGITEQTVKNHLSSVLLRMGVSNRRRAVEYAVRQGWLSADDGVPPGRTLSAPAAEDPQG